MGSAGRPSECLDCAVAHGDFCKTCGRSFPEQPDVAVVSGPAAERSSCRSPGLMSPRAGLGRFFSRSFRVGSSESSMTSPRSVAYAQTNGSTHRPKVPWEKMPELVSLRLLPEHVRKELRLAFRALDVDGDGELGAADLAVQLGSHEEARELLCGEDCLNFKTFLSVMSEDVNLDTRYHEKILCMCRELDPNNTHYVTVEQFRAVLARVVGRSILVELNEFLRRWVTSDSDLLDYDAFVKATTTWMNNAAREHFDTKVQSSCVSAKNDGLLWSFRRNSRRSQGDVPQSPRSLTPRQSTPRSWRWMSPRNRYLDSGWTDADKTVALSPRAHH